MIGVIGNDLEDRKKIRLARHQAMLDKAISDHLNKPAK